MPVIWELKGVQENILVKLCFFMGCFILGRESFIIRIE